MKPIALGTIRSRLLAGFGAVIVLLAAAGIVGRSSLTSLSERIGSTLAATRREARLTADLTSDVAQELSAGGRSLQTRDTASQNAFRAYGVAAHRAQQELSASPDMNADDLALIADIGDRLTALENALAVAHRLKDLGRDREAASADSSAQLSESALLASVHQLGQRRARQMELTSLDLRAEADRRSLLLVAFIAGAVLLGVLIVMHTVRAITVPLAALVAHARALSGGRLGVRTSTQMPGEFRDLASAMNATADSLSTLVDVATTTAEEVSTSAHQLASAAEQIRTPPGTRRRRCPKSPAARPSR